MNLLVSKRVEEVTDVAFGPLGVNKPTTTVRPMTTTRTKRTGRADGMMVRDEGAAGAVMTGAGAVVERLFHFGHDR